MSRQWGNKAKIKEEVEERYKDKMLFIAKRIRSRIKELEMTDYQLSNLSGVARSSICRILQGESINMYHLFAIEEVLRINIFYLPEYQDMHDELYLRLGRAVFDVLSKYSSNETGKQE